MKKLTSKQKLEVEKLFGWKPNKEICLLILDRMKEGDTIYEAAGRFAMPTIHILDDDQPVSPPRYKGERRIIVTGPNWKGGKNDIDK
jgi:hypothetical protein